jgi:3'-phosphoadenosine 5'-phosphosulfate (PAPS) 3'-phosphatase
MNTNSPLYPFKRQGGFAKWDTSGPAAVLEAHGGTMSKLPPFLKDKTLQA